MTLSGNPLAFCGNPLDRAGGLRPDPAWVAARQAEPGARFLPLWQMKVLVAGDSAARLAWDVVAPLAGPDTPCVFLGLEEGHALFALDVSAAGEAPPLAGDGEFLDMRAAAFRLCAADTAILGQAKALVDWHRRHRFCPNCGTLTGPSDGGTRRLCPQCGAEHFPRTDPVVIMLPVWNDQCLVGRNRRFADGLYSAFAGFVEPGETMEEAVRRELMEEAGIKAGTVRYHASQPWPFPSSLMIGCYAEAPGPDFTIDGSEIIDARWIGRSEMAQRLAGAIDDGIKLPAPIAIAHMLVKDWVGQ